LPDTSLFQIEPHQSTVDRDNRTIARPRGNNGMPKVISVHEYILKPDVPPDQFENAVREAEQRGLLALPGLVGYHFVRGIKGPRASQFSAIWIYESRVAWEALWGTVDRPKSKHEYPSNWLEWEDKILAPLLAQEPDTITFNSHEELRL
jgi:hypothetical protein